MGFGKHFWIYIRLIIPECVPGIVHAVWVIAKY
nr:YqaE/Pmp3 family membrane protein [Rubrobacter xylanophilus]